MLLGYVLTGCALGAMVVFDAATPYWLIALLFLVAGFGQGLGALALALTPALERQPAASPRAADA
jgi:hypothetical protein